MQGINELSCTYTLYAMKHNIDDHCLPDRDKYLQSDCKNVHLGVFTNTGIPAVTCSCRVQLPVTASGEELLQWGRHLVTMHFI